MIDENYEGDDDDDDDGDAQNMTGDLSCGGREYKKMHLFPLVSSLTMFFPNGTIHEPCKIKGVLLPFRSIACFKEH